MDFLGALRRIFGISNSTQGPHIAESDSRNQQDSNGYSVTDEETDSENLSGETDDRIGKPFF